MKFCFFFKNYFRRTIPSSLEISIINISNLSFLCRFCLHPNINCFAFYLKSKLNSRRHTANTFCTFIHFFRYCKRKTVQTISFLLLPNFFHIVKINILKYHFYNSSSVVLQYIQLFVSLLSFKLFTIYTMSSYPFTAPIIIPFT